MLISSWWPGLQVSCPIIRCLQIFPATGSLSSLSVSEGGAISLMSRGDKLGPGVSRSSPFSGSTVNCASYSICQNCPLIVKRFHFTVTIVLRILLFWLSSSPSPSVWNSIIASISTQPCNKLSFPRQFSPSQCVFPQPPSHIFLHKTGRLIKMWRGWSVCDMSVNISPGSGSEKPSRNPIKVSDPQTLPFSQLGVSNGQTQKWGEGIHIYIGTHQRGARGRRNLLVPLILVTKTDILVYNALRDEE